MAIILDRVRGRLHASPGKGIRRLPGPAYYAHPGNRFWRVLHAIGLVPRRLSPAEFGLLPQWGLGLTDVAKYASGADRDLGPGCFDRSGFRARITEAAPAFVAFNGKAAARAAIGATARVRYGPCMMGDGLPPGFVLPSTSGAASGCWDEGPWRDLARMAARNREAATRVQLASVPAHKNVSAAA